MRGHSKDGGQFEGDLDSGSSGNRKGERGVIQQNRGREEGNVRTTQ